MAIMRWIRRLSACSCSRRSAAALHECHPSRRTAPRPVTAGCETLQDEDRFGELLSFRPQFGEHFVDVH